jgi:uncharacterized protein (TIGR03435 family)
MQSGEVLMDAEPWRIPEPDDYRPAFAPSKTLHVSVSKGEENGNYGGDDFWSRKGYTLKKLVAEIYDVEPIRVALPAALDDGRRYDFALVVPEHLEQEGMRALARQGVQDYFHIALTRERRLVEVYVVTTAGGSPPSAKALPTDGGMAFFSGASFMFASSAGDKFAPPEGQPLSAMRSFSMSDGTIEDFCRNLEMNLDWPVVDETELKGRFDFAMKGDPDPRATNDKNDFPERLREQLHLAITSAQRQVEVLAFYPQGN